MYIIHQVNHIFYAVFVLFSLGSDPLCGSVTCADDQVLMTDTCECGDGDGGDGDGGDGDGDGGDGDGDGDDEDGGSITSESTSIDT